ncbi:hypothetical protein BN59_03748 [Legionella massiliensis]|uniref:Uncharacterized protein n=1 Tax=Legionella massiliensis TaxID=1034943 RepID=A0A078KYI7_9GAMM|nr:hypothetical protein [Legionella massiliensis]CDZ79430.1 hypothetical protein BN59_03748 [Legionella massiliensis]CEE15168.1 hypothetical protein BN1094_03748 [Legionella massiliensis]
MLGKIDIATANLEFSDSSSSSYYEDSKRSPKTSPSLLLPPTKLVKEKKIVNATEAVDSSAKLLDKDGLTRTRAIIQFRREFCEFVCNNVGVFEDGAYLLVSMDKESNPANDRMHLYPGSGVKYREGAEVPEKFRDPQNPLQMHPILDLQIRQKAHRVFHEGILGKKISILQTILPHPFVDGYQSRGGGAILISDTELQPHYKSGVLNGKWTLPLIGEKLAYGDLPEADHSRFKEAMRKTTGKAIIESTVANNTRAVNQADNTETSEDISQNLATQEFYNNDAEVSISNKTIERYKSRLQFFSPLLEKQGESQGKDLANSAGILFFAFLIPTVAGWLYLALELFNVINELFSKNENGQNNALCH